MEITQLRLPTVDHYEPSLEDLLKAHFQEPGKDRTLDRGLRSCRIRPSSLLRSSDSVDTKFMFTAKPRPKVEDENDLEQTQSTAHA